MTTGNCAIWGGIYLSIIISDPPSDGLRIIRKLQNDRKTFVSTIFLQTHRYILFFVINNVFTDNYLLKIIKIICSII